MRTLFTATSALILTAGVAHSGVSADLVLGCKGTLRLKHYNEEHDANAVMRVNPAGKSITITTAEKVGVYDPNGPLTWKTEEKTDSYVINLDGADFIGFSKPEYDEKHIVMKLDAQKNPVRIDVEKDDVASGTLNRVTGDVEISTKYFTTGTTSEDGTVAWIKSFFVSSQPRYEYGWRLAMSCKTPP